ncbi:MAG: DUF4340 domain-containing protein [Spirochaetaceae bacterium]|jgi:hypothetical protein|nr:DUF4340 domain-containing protein [Spirochaetaceae bacterium]
MIYRTKVIVLSVITGALALVYAALLVFNPGRMTTRSAYYTWLDAKIASEAERIALSSSGDPVNLVKQDGAWFVETGAELYPAKAARVEELLAALSDRGLFPVRAASAAARDRLGLGDNAEKRIVVSRASGTALIDLIVGDYDAAGLEVYYRRMGRDEARSGSAAIFQFLNYARASWYDLRFFPEEIPVNRIDRVTAISPAGETVVFLQEETGWRVDSFDPAVTDTAKVESYIRGIISAEGDDFTAHGGDDFTAGRVLVETEGRTLFVRLGGELPVENEEQPARRRLRTSAADSRTLAVSSWTADRLFRDAASFLKTE